METASRCLKIAQGNLESELRMCQFQNLHLDSSITRFRMYRAPVWHTNYQAKPTNQSSKTFIWWTLLQCDQGDTSPLKFQVIWLEASKWTAIPLIHSNKNKTELFCSTMGNILVLSCPCVKLSMIGYHINHLDNERGANFTGSGRCLNQCLSTNFLYTDSKVTTPKRCLI